MKPGLVELRFNKLLREYDFLISDEQYRSELIEEYRQLFMEEVSNDLPTRSADKKKEEPPKKEKNQYLAGDPSLKKIKRLYREIAKICHPDKTSDSFRNSLYVLAEIAYSENNLIALFKISTQLGLRFQIDDFDLDLILSIVEEKRKTISSIEQSFIWLWIHAPSDEFKKQIILKFIEVHQNNL